MESLKTKQRFHAGNIYSLELFLTEVQIVTRLFFFIYIYIRISRTLQQITSSKCPQTLLRYTSILLHNSPVRQSSYITLKKKIKSTHILITVNQDELHKQQDTVSTRGIVI